jgi:hypothetical protein
MLIRTHPESTVLHPIQINNLVNHIQQHVISFIPNRMYCNLIKIYYNFSERRQLKMNDASNKKMST